MPGSLMSRFSYKVLCKKRFNRNVNKIQESLSVLLKDANKLKGYAMTDNDDKLAKNLVYAIENALDIASTNKE